MDCGSGPGMNRFLLPVILFCGAGFAGTVPAVEWAKQLSGDCYFVAGTGDSVICVGKTIAVVSENGTLLSESPPLDDTKDIVDRRIPEFRLAGDRSILMLKNRSLLKKITMNGATAWSKSLGDSISGAVFSGFAEDNNGNLYLCGSVEGQSGIIVKVGNGGVSVYKKDTSLPIFTSASWRQDTLFAVARKDAGTVASGCLVAMNEKGTIVEEIIDSGCGSPIVIEGGNVFSVLTQDRKSGLSRRMLSAASDIIIRRHAMDGKTAATTIFDFGKSEYPWSLGKYNDGILLITVSDESYNMGSNYLNYHITMLDTSLDEQWQLHFGTDTLDGASHYRSFCSGGRGVLWATHNDTLFRFTDESVRAGRTAFRSGEIKPPAPGDAVLMVDCMGRQLGMFPAGSKSATSDLAPGMRLLRSKACSGGRKGTVDLEAR